MISLPPTRAVRNTLIQTAAQTAAGGICIASPRIIMIIVADSRRFTTADSWPVHDYNWLPSDRPMARRSSDQYS